MPLTDLAEPVKHTDGGALFFAVDDATGERVLISVESIVLDYYRDGGCPLDEPGFRRLIVDTASRVNDAASTKFGYVTINAEVMDIPA